MVVVCNNANFSIDLIQINTGPVLLVLVTTLIILTWAAHGCILPCMKGYFLGTC